MFLVVTPSPRLSVTDGFGETSETRRPLKEGEVGEWILLDAVSMLLVVETVTY